MFLVPWPPKEVPSALRSASGMNRTPSKELEGIGPPCADRLCGRRFWVRVRERNWHQPLRSPSISGFWSPMDSTGVLKSDWPAKATRMALRNQANCHTRHYGVRLAMSCLTACVTVALEANSFSTRS